MRRQELPTTTIAALPDAPATDAPASTATTSTPDHGSDDDASTDHAAADHRCTSARRDRSPDPHAGSVAAERAHPPEPENRIGSISIPKLGINAVLFEGVTLTTLNKGPGHWPGTALPSQTGNVVVVGHRVTHSRPSATSISFGPGDQVSSRSGAHSTRTNSPATRS